jgi:hypothetical protein
MAATKTILDQTRQTMTVPDAGQVGIRVSGFGIRQETAKSGFTASARNSKPQTRSPKPESRDPNSVRPSSSAASISPP